MNVIFSSLLEQRNFETFDEILIWEPSTFSRFDSNEYTSAIFKSQTKSDETSVAQITHPAFEEMKCNQKIINIIA